MAKKSLALSKVYGLLEPGPVVLLSTARKAKSNIMTMSWHTMLEFEPPLIGCVVSDRNYSFSLLKASKEWVIIGLSQALVYIARCSISRYSSAVAMRGLVL